MMLRISTMRMAAFLVGSLATAGMAAAATCESLASLSLPNTTITTAQSVAAGAFYAGAGGGKGKAASFTDVPSFCRVAFTVKPTSDSDIKIELWMPASGWNHKFEANGNGGWSGAITPATLATGLIRR